MAGIPPQPDVFEASSSDAWTVPGPFSVKEQRFCTVSSSKCLGSLPSYQWVSPVTLQRKLSLVNFSFFQSLSLEFMTEAKFSPHNFQSRSRRNSYYTTDWSHTLSHTIFHQEKPQTSITNKKRALKCLSNFPLRLTPLEAWFCKFLYIFAKIADGFFTHWQASLLMPHLSNCPHVPNYSTVFIFAIFVSVLFTAHGS